MDEDGRGQPVTVARQRLARPAPWLAPRLLGAVLVSVVDEVEVAVRLTEVEAYAGLRRRRLARLSGTHGAQQRSCSARPVTSTATSPTACTGARTSSAGRTAGPKRCCCGPARSYAAWTRARARRPAARTAAELARGPARLATALGLTSRQYGADLCSDAVARPAGGGCRDTGRADVAAGPRVGITVAAERRGGSGSSREPSVSAFRPGSRRVRTVDPAHWHLVNQRGGGDASDVTVAALPSSLREAHEILASGAAQILPAERPCRAAARRRARAPPAAGQARHRPVRQPS